MQSILLRPRLLVGSTGFLLAVLMLVALANQAPTSAAHSSATLNDPKMPANRMSDQGLSAPQREPLEMFTTTAPLTPTALLEDDSLPSGAYRVYLPVVWGQPASSSNQHQTYTDEHYGFHFDYPADWQIEHSFDHSGTEDPVIINRRITVYPQADSLSQFRVDVWDNPESLSLPDWFETYESPMHPDDATVQQDPDIRIAGLPGILVSEPAVEQAHHGRLTAMVSYDDIIVRIDYYMNEGGQHQRAFLDVVRSLAFTAHASSVSQLPPAPLIDSQSATLAASYCCTWYDPNDNTYPCSGGNCTWWAKYKRPDIGNYWGNAEAWRNRARQYGYSVGYTARVGAVAVWQPWVGIAGQWGHVAYVTSVEGGGQFHISDMSWGRGCHVGNNGVLTYAATETGDEGLTFIYPPNQRPNTPSLLSPANGSTVSTSVTFTWKDNGDPDNQPNPSRNYVVELYRNGTKVADSGWITTTSWTPSTLASGSYTWRVKAGDGYASSYWSGSRSFTAETPNQPPNAPSLLTPVNGGATNSNTMTFTWKDNGDPDNRPNPSRNYLIELYRNGAKVANSGWINAPSWSYSNLAPGTYEWQVKAGDGQVSSSWAGLWTFTVDTTAPDGNLTLNYGWSTAEGLRVPLDLTASDTHSGIGEMRLGPNCSSLGDWQPFQTRHWWTLSGQHGDTVGVCAQFRDRAGNTSTAVERSLRLDFYPQQPASASYRLRSDVSALGGETHQSSSYRLHSTTGQALASGNYASSGSYRVALGFWPRVVAPVGQPTDPTDPSLQSDYQTGGPGSVFVFTADHFPAGAMLHIALREPAMNTFKPLMQLPVPENGRLVFALAIPTSAAPGEYVVRVSVDEAQQASSGLQASLVREQSVTIQTDAPVHNDPPASNIPVMDTDGRLHVFLPFIQR